MPVRARAATPSMVSASYPRSISSASTASTTSSSSRSPRRRGPRRWSSADDPPPRTPRLRAGGDDVAPVAVDQDPLPVDQHVGPVPRGHDRGDPVLPGDDRGVRAEGTGVGDDGCGQREQRGPGRVRVRADEHVAGRSRPNSAGPRTTRTGPVARPPPPGVPDTSASVAGRRLRGCRVAGDISGACPSSARRAVRRRTRSRRSRRSSSSRWRGSRAPHSSASCRWNTSSTWSRTPASVSLAPASSSAERRTGRSRSAWKWLSSRNVSPARPGLRGAQHEVRRAGEPDHAGSAGPGGRRRDPGLPLAPGVGTGHQGPDVAEQQRRVVAPGRLGDERRAGRLAMAVRPSHARRASRSGGRPGRARHGRDEVGVGRVPEQRHLLGVLAHLPGEVGERLVRGTGPRRRPADERPELGPQAEHVQQHPDPDDVDDDAWQVVDPEVDEACPGARAPALGTAVRSAQLRVERSRSCRSRSAPLVRREPRVLGPAGRVVPPELSPEPPGRGQRAPGGSRLGRPDLGEDAVLGGQHPPDVDPDAGQLQRHPRQDPEPSRRGPRGQVQRERAGWAAARARIPPVARCTAWSGRAPAAARSAAVPAPARSSPAA